MDAHTVECLEFDRIRELLAGFAMTRLGAALARGIRPAANLAIVRRWLGQIEELKHAEVSIGLPPFGGSSDVPEAKPAPDMVYRACEVLGVEPWDVLVVGDSPYDRDAAAAAGAPFAGIGGIEGNFTLSDLRQVLEVVDGTFR
ncbi:MAG: HAD-IA family hydrolase [Chloroflexi bacterium]|nr:HAD-IA family hydrolase [Chloroflexota bacterium]